MVLLALWACSSSIELKPLEDQTAGLNPEPAGPDGSGGSPSNEPSDAKQDPGGQGGTVGGEVTGPTPLATGNGGAGGGSTDGRDDAVAGAGGGTQPPPLMPPACADADGDTLCDAVDLCPNVADDGADRDADGRPNACDLCPDVAQDDSRDADADGKPDACDSCGIGVAIALSPLFYFPLDEAATAATAINLGSVGQTATYLGPVERGLAGVSDPRGRAIRMAGQEGTEFSRVTLLNARAFPSTALTAMFWVRTEQEGDYAVLSYAIPTSQNEFGIVIEGGLIRLTLQSSTFVADDLSASRITDGTWHFVALTWQGTRAQFYFDGEAAGSPLITEAGFELIERAAIPVAGPLHLSPGGALVFGQDQDGVNSGFSAAQALAGGLDEVAIYDRVLSPEQIRSIFTATTCGERCDGVDNDADGTVDEGFLGSAPACAAASCAAIAASSSAFGFGDYFSSADPEVPLTCSF
ncbi:MAG: LamG-like jellyroll fold domain-containing protein [Deltaproteobacteria bacterium]